MFYFRDIIYKDIIVQRQFVGNFQYRSMFHGPFSAWEIEARDVTFNFSLSEENVRIVMNRGVRSKGHFVHLTPKARDVVFFNCKFNKDRSVSGCLVHASNSLDSTISQFRKKSPYFSASMVNPRDKQHLCIIIKRMSCHVHTVDMRS